MTSRHQAAGLIAKPRRVYEFLRYCRGCGHKRGLDGGSGGRRPWLCRECWPKKQARAVG